LLKAYPLINFRLGKVRVEACADFSRAKSAFIDMLLLIENFMRYARQQSSRSKFMASGKLELPACRADERQDWNFALAGPAKGETALPSLAHQRGLIALAGS
jgi:hypothetical protein